MKIVVTFMMRVTHLSIFKVMITIMMRMTMMMFKGLSGLLKRYSR